LVVAVTVALVAAAGVRGARTARSAHLARNPVLEETVARFATLKGSVASTTPLGFASALEPADPAYSMRQMLARFALAPASLDAADVHPLVLADFETEAELGAYVARVGGTILAHPQPGLAIIKRSPSAP
jgi:hypothetical protein